MGVIDMHPIGDGNYFIREKLLLAAELTELTGCEY